MLKAIVVTMCNVFVTYVEKDSMTTVTLIWEGGTGNTTRFWHYMWYNITGGGQRLFKEGHFKL